MTTKRRSRALGWTLALSLAAAAGAAVLATSEPSGAQQAPRPAATAPTVVHITKHSTDPHAVAMALQLARALQDGGASVIVLLDLEGARLADARTPADFKMAEADPSAAQLYDRAVQAGAKVLVCAHCAKAAGMDGKALRPGARIATDQEFSNAIRSAGQVIDY